MVDILTCALYELRFTAYKITFEYMCIWHLSTEQRHHKLHQTEHKSFNDYI